MSSTNRGAKRNGNDYYRTPEKPILDFLSALKDDAPNINGFPIGMPVGILDPCAGGDAKHTMSYPAAIQKFGWFNVKNLWTMDIRADSRAQIKADYLHYCIPPSEPNIIITNPPFNLALAIIKKALRDVASRGFVIMLLRLNFFGSQERSQWLKKNMPLWCYVHSKRMSFTDGQTDSIEYAHFIWQKNSNPYYTNLRIV